MAKQQTSEQLAAFQQLCRDNSLDPRADVWQQPQSGTWIIARTGIEKIQGKNNIAVALEMVRCEPDFACVKATATRTVKPEGTRTSTKLVTESFGSALPGNCKVNYFAEMAEKRALSRAVLKNMGFYALGVYGEDEAEDFKRPVEAAVAAPKKPEAAAVTPAPTSPALSTGAAEKEELLQAGALLPGIRSKMDLKELWDSLSAPAQGLLKDEFTAARERIEAAIAEAVKTPLAQKPVTTTAPENRATLDAQGLPIVYATVEQRQEIERLLNHPVVTRQQKTNTLLGLNKLTEEGAADVLAKLNVLIDGPAGETERKRVAEAFRKWLREQSYNKLIALKEVERLVNLAEKARIGDLNAAWAAARAAIEASAVAA